MPDLYEYSKEKEWYNVFWHEEEFYLHDRLWWSKLKGEDYHSEFRYFDTSEECLKAMLKIGPFRDWKIKEEGFVG